MTDSNNKSDKIQVFFTKKEIEEAGGHIEIENDGKLSIFIPRVLLDNKISEGTVSTCDNKQMGDDDDDDWKKKGL